jgi:hypothetical protein
MACDEWVVARTGSPKAYARCLARAAEVRGRMKVRCALAPALFGSRHDLMRRVDRLLKLKGRARRNVSFAGAMAAALALAVSSVQLQGLRFAEIADAVLPSVARPIIAVYDEATTSLTELPVDVELRWNSARLQKADAPTTAPIAPTAPAESVAFSAPVAPLAPFAPIAPGAAPSAPITPPAPTVSSVAFAGVYPAANPPVASSADEGNRWIALSTPGVEIASAAKKTSIGVANAVSRAGVSLARSF